jgi:hypothetical protein
VVQVAVLAAVVVKMVVQLEMVALVFQVKEIMAALEVRHLMFIEVVAVVERVQ